MSTRHTPKKQYSLAITVSLLIMLTTITLLFTPPGQAFAQQALRYFVPIQQTAYPVSPAVQTAEAGAEAVVPTEAPTPTSIAALACQHSDPTEQYLCETAFAQEELGFAVKALPAGYRGLGYLQFEIYSLPPSMQKVLYLSYGPEPYGAIYILQGQGNFPVTLSLDGSDDLWSQVPPEAVQTVSVHGQPGEYVEGGFVRRPGSEAYTWEPEMPLARLRWKEDNTWFQITRAGTPEALTDVIGTKESFVKIAESLTPVSELDQE